MAKMWLIGHLRPQSRQYTLVEMSVGVAGLSTSLHSTASLPVGSSNLTKSSFCDLTRTARSSMRPRSSSTTMTPESRRFVSTMTPCSQLHGETTNGMCDGMPHNQMCQTNQMHSQMFKTTMWSCPGRTQRQGAPGTPHFVLPLRYFASFVMRPLLPPGVNHCKI